ncbi:MAG: right-handed parallel beta-helix repeat-containing protein [Candidatus Thorarchaeota archaeon]
MEESILRSERVLIGLFLLLLMIIPSLIIFAIGIQSHAAVVTQTKAYSPSQIASNPIVIDSDADFAALGATGVGTRADPYVLENLYISTIGTCITVTGTTSFFRIYNCILESDPNSPVIQFNDVENGQIVLCEIVGGSSGVEFLSAVDCTIANSTIYQCWYGIRLNLSQNCTIAYSRIFNNHRGLLFDSGEFTQVESNTIYSNNENGLEFAWTTNNNTVVGNRFGWNGMSGFLQENALDHGEDNHFDDGVSRGNSWSDFNGTTPYSILGTSGNNDSFPELLEDNNVPYIYEHMDTAIDVETTGNILAWIVSDEFPHQYRIEIDGNPLISSSWNGDSIRVSLDELPVGSYLYVVTVSDAAGNHANDQVYVNVVSFVLGGIGTELVMIASGLTVAIFLVMMLIIKKLS